MKDQEIRLHPDWASGATKDDQDKFFQIVKSYRDNAVFKQFLLILQRKQEELAREEYDVDSYKDASWSYKQAHINGERSALRYFEKLFNFVNKENA